jgi:hypothetical protein
MPFSLTTLPFCEPCQSPPFVWTDSEFSQSLSCLSLCAVAGLRVCQRLRPGACFCIPDALVYVDCVVLFRGITPCLALASVRLLVLVSPHAARFVSHFWPICCLLKRVSRQYKNDVYFSLFDASFCVCLYGCVCYQLATRLRHLHCMHGACFLLTTTVSPCSVRRGRVCTT